MIHKFKLDMRVNIIINKVVVNLLEKPVEFHTNCYS